MIRIFCKRENYVPLISLSLVYAALNIYFTGTKNSMERMQNHSFLNSINYESRKHFERKFKSMMMTALLRVQLKIGSSN